MHRLQASCLLILHDGEKISIASDFLNGIILNDVVTFKINEMKKILLTSFKISFHHLIPNILNVRFNHSFILSKFEVLLHSNVIQTTI